MSEIRTVSVTFDAENLSLEVAEREIEVEPGQIVEWVLEGVPRSLSPIIIFEQDEQRRRLFEKGKHYYGPFPEITQVLSVVNDYRMYVWGEVQRDLGDTFEYRVAVQKGISEDACDEDFPGKPESVGKTFIVSEIFKIRVDTAAAPRTRAERAIEHEAARAKARTIPVREKPAREHALSILEQDKKISLEDGDSLFWDFTATFQHESYVPQLDFVGVEDPKGPITNVHFGHFTSLTYSSEGVFARGCTGVQGIYHYRVSMFSYSNNSMRSKSSPDPDTDPPPIATEP